MALRRRALLYGSFSLTVILLVLSATFLCLQRAILYNPYQNTKEDEVRILQKYGYTQNVSVDLISSDDTRLRGYWIPLPDDKIGSSPTVLYLHGNGGKIEWGLNASKNWQKQMDVNFMIISYRGFGRSEGQPTIEGIKLDSQAALDFLRSHPKIDKDKIVLFGHSLGGSVALHLAQRNPNKIAAVIVENTFLKISKVVFGNGKIASLIEPLITDNWCNESVIDTFQKQAKLGESVPHLLLLSGLKDKIVPSWHMAGLWEMVKAISGPKEITKIWREFVNCNHTCHLEPGYHDRIKTFLEQIFNKV